jgi:HK97 family phage portal protein
MATMFDWLRKTINQKASIGQQMFTDQWEYSLTDLKDYAQEGYGQNPTIYSCISLIADAFASVPLKVKVGDEIKKDHPLRTILDRPNPDEGGVEFRTAAASWILLTGNCFTEKLKVTAEKMELWNWQPYEMSVGYAKGMRMPKAYAFAKESADPKFWDIDPITGESDMLHWRRFNPSPKNSGMGQSPLMAGAASADQMNAAAKWRYNTFKNNAAPSGVLSTEQQIDSTKRKALESDLKKKQQGTNNARQIMLLGGGLKWQQVAMSPQDMDWLNGTKMLAQEICAVLRVPTQLIGLEGSQTYANFAEAKIGLYTQAVLPLLDLYVSELNRFFKNDFEGATICYQTEDIEALEPLRRYRRTELLGTDVLTINEKRELLGYDAMDEDEANTLFVQPNDIPLGSDILDEDDKDMTAAAKAFMNLEGISYQEAYQKAFDIKQDADESEL